EEFYSRTVMLIGERLNKVKTATVAVFGLGGVGSFVAEALARSGVGHIVLVDNDIVSASNSNRQLCAFNSTIGRLKVEVMRERILDINQDCIIEAYPTFVGEDTINQFDFASFTAVADAVDNVTAKLLIATYCKEQGIYLCSSMGTGNKLNPQGVTVTDIYSTSVCPLAKVMRRELRKRGIEKLDVVYSEEEPISIGVEQDGKRIPSSAIFVPAVAGITLAYQIFQHIIDIKEE
ncbi:MAG: tRNA threonylcarbamoyladenosine dehydratase, partial [Clostridia bacterium]